MFQVVIDSDVEMMVRMVFVFSEVGMDVLKVNFVERFGASIKKLSGGRKNDELAKK